MKDEEEFSPIEYSVKKLIRLLQYKNNSRIQYYVLNSLLYLSYQESSARVIASSDQFYLSLADIASSANDISFRFLIAQLLVNLNKYGIILLQNYLTYYV